jgi:hypothetical protein
MASLALVETLLLELEVIMRLLSWRDEYRHDLGVLFSKHLLIFLLSISQALLVKDSLTIHRIIATTYCVDQLLITSRLDGPCSS